jgi:SAM-dependent methyltransferase
VTLTVTPSPNIWQHPQVYERLNRAADPDGLLPRALDGLLGGRRLAVVVDVGCGSGFHLPMLAARAHRVLGVEPHAGLVALARRRVARARLCDRVEVRTGAAQQVPLATGSADLVFSHWAYFFGPGCEQGLVEAGRVLRPGGVQIVVDLDVEAEDGYARWFAASGADARADRSATFFADRGFRTRRVPMLWSFTDRDEMAAVLRIEFPPRVAAQALEETVGTTVLVPTAMRWRVLAGTAPAVR